MGNIHKHNNYLALQARRVFLFGVLCVLPLLMMHLPRASCFQRKRINKNIRNKCNSVFYCSNQLKDICSNLKCWLVFNFLQFSVDITYIIAKHNSKTGCFQNLAFFISPLFSWSKWFAFTCKIPRMIIPECPIITLLCMSLYPRNIKLCLRFVRSFLWN